MAFVLPKLSKKDIEKGVHYVDTVPQKDFLGQELNEGDYCIYSGSANKSGDLEVVKVLGIYTRYYPEHYEPLDTMVQVLKDYGYKQSVKAKALVKLHPEQHSLVRSFKVNFDDLKKGDWYRVEGDERIFEKRGQRTSVNIANGEVSKGEVGEYYFVIRVDKPEEI